MMWFQRPEFDRYARFHSHGSAREIFDWDELCNVMIPLPSIERQREIVEEYETLSRRISLNEQMIQKLEATAQTLYRKMFVDGIDKENLPDGWNYYSLFDISKVIYGFPFNSELFSAGIRLLSFMWRCCDTNRLVPFAEQYFAYFITFYFQE